MITVWARLSEYELQRLENIKRNQGVLDQLGLASSPAPTARKPKAKRARQDPERLAALELISRRSSRLSNQPAPSYKEDSVDLRSKRPRVVGGSDDDQEYAGVDGSLPPDEEDGQAEGGASSHEAKAKPARAAPAGDPKSSKFATCDIAHMDREQVRDSSRASHARAVRVTRPLSFASWVSTFPRPRRAASRQA